MYDIIYDVLSGSLHETLIVPPSVKLPFSLDIVTIKGPAVYVGGLR